MHLGQFGGIGWDTTGFDVKERSAGIQQQNAGRVSQSRGSRYLAKNRWGIMGRGGGKEVGVYCGQGGRVEGARMWKEGLSDGRRREEEVAMDEEHADEGLGFWRVGRSGMNARDDRHGRRRRGVEKEKGRSKARTTENEERADGGRGNDLELARSAHATLSGPIYFSAMRSRGERMEDWYGDRISRRGESRLCSCSRAQLALPRAWQYAIAHVRRVT
ncbi:hypothetical protein C8J57DRAFT_1638014 [Mycena rebaudengoi]|nr:hypothetical protein C8J57DRAFT_1638014 [Mycena rebaudengoi]